MYVSWYEVTSYPTRVILGTGHLVGERSVNELLEERGSVLERRGVECFARGGPVDGVRGPGRICGNHE